MMVDHKAITSVLAVLVFPLILTVSGLSACGLLNNGRSVYDHDGFRIGLQADPSVRPSDPTHLNNHPINLTATDLKSLLGVIQVSGYSGTIVGFVTRPQPISLFTPEELSAIGEHLARAFREARPTERVSFSLPKPGVVYSEDRTVGYLFFRGPYLHVIVTDHSSIIRTDTGGGDYKDIRDTKGMKLWVAGPAQAAMVPDFEEPRWAPFERVHISLAIKNVLTQKENMPAARTNQGKPGSPIPLPAAVSSENRQNAPSPENLQRQLRDLSGENRELRDRLDEQNKRMQQLQEQIERLHPPSDMKGQP